MLPAARTAFTSAALLGASPSFDVTTSSGVCASAGACPAKAQRAPPDASESASDAGVTPASVSMSLAIHFTTSARAIPATKAPMSAAEMRIAPARRRSCDAVLTTTRPPMLCPAITMRVVSRPSESATAGVRSQASTASASSRLPAKEKVPGLPQVPR